MDKLRQQTLVTWLRQQRRLAKPWLTLCVLYGGLSAGLLIAQAWLLAELLHGFIIHGLQKSTQLPLLLLLLGLTVARSLLAMARERAAFSDILRECRLGQALMLLQTSPWPVARIAAECGYDCASRFAVSFRQRYGLSPSALRATLPAG